MLGRTRLYAFGLLALFLIASSAPSLALLRRPLHDTAAGLLPIRVWVSDVLHAGDWPLWYPYPRYGVPLTSLHFVSNVFSPIGLALGAAFPYNVWTLAVEQALWRVIGLAGAYAFARHHIISPIAAAAAAAVYVGGGGVAPTISAGAIFPGLMVAPWLLVGIDWATSGQGVRGVLSSAGVLGLSGAALVLAGYPGTWGTAPALLAPYALVTAGGRARTTAALVVASALGTLLAAGMALLSLWETATLSLFGGAARNAIITSEGALAGRSLLALFLPNPTYLLSGWPANLQPQYVGALTALLLCASFLPPRLRGDRTMRLGALVSAGLLLSVYAVPRLQVVAQRSAAGISPPPSALPGEGAVVAATFLLLLFAFPSLPPGGTWTRADTALRLTALWSLLVATENPLSTYLRTAVPPFTLVRWNGLYSWVAVLMLAVIAWRTAERILPRLPVGQSHTAAEQWREAFAGIMVAVAGLGAFVAALVLLLPTSLELIPAGEHLTERINTAALVWCGALVIASGVLALAGGYRSLDDSSGFLWAVGIGLLAIAAVLGVLFSHRDEIVGGMVELLPSGRALLDLAHIGGVVAAAAVGIRRGPRAALSWAAVLTALDLAAAAARYGSDAHQLHTPRHVEVVHSLAFRGAERFLEEPQDWAFLDSALTKRPTMAVWQGLLPELAALDREAGAPSIFRRFANFPPRWWSAPSADGVTVIPAELRGAILPDDAPPNVASGGANGPACTSGAAAETPAATVTQLLSTRVRLDVQTACERLLVYMDTWAPAWRAHVDGRPVPTLRVNGAVRGVLMPAGTHTLEWTYRPDHLPALVTVMALSLVVAVALICVRRWAE